MIDALIVDALRTPRAKGKPGGSLSGVHPQLLLAGVLNQLRERTGLRPSIVEDVITGCANAQGDHGDCVGRLAVLAAGWPVTVPGVTLNRFCGSGQQALNYAAMMIASGQADVVIAAGVEMMSRYAPGGRPTLDGANPQIYEKYPLVPQGISADLIASVEGFSRVAVDAFAAESQRRAAVAIAEGRFGNSMVPVVDDHGAVVLDGDELPRNTSVEKLASLSPAFAEMGSMVHDGYGTTFDDNCRAVYPDVQAVEHVHHAGNSSGIADGASAILLASPSALSEHGWHARARVVATAAIGSDPVIMLTAPAPAAQLCLGRGGMAANDIDLFEVNEAFAAVVLKFMRDLRVDHNKVNVNGGAIALGHPIGATGPMLVGTVLDELERQDRETGLITMCTGAGMGTATIIERI